MRAIVVAVVTVVALAGIPPAAASSDLPLLSPPVDAQITRRFEEPRMDWGPGHRGIDYGVAAGTGVRAATFGTISFAGSVAGILAVTIDHGRGLETTYSQLAEVSVDAGEVVAAGTWIGVAGEAHSELEGGLHLGVKLNGEYVDPEDHLGPVDASRAIHLTRLVHSVSEDSLLAEYLPRLPGSPFRPCVPTQPLDETPPPANDNLAVVIGGIASSTQGHPDDIFSVPARLGYETADIFHFSYRGGDGHRLHEPYGPEDTWGDLRGYAADLAEQLRRVRAQHPGRAIDLIAHSQGGIVARYMLALAATEWDASMPPIENLITFSTPHRGAPLAGAAGDLRSSPVGRVALEAGSWLAERGKIRIDPSATAVDQLAPGSPLLDSLASTDTMFGTRVLALNLPNDPIVPADRAVWPGKETVTVPPTGWLAGHSAIVRSPFALASAYDFLRGGAPACTNNWSGVATGAGWLTGLFERSLTRWIDPL